MKKIILLSLFLFGCDAISDSVYKEHEESIYSLQYFRAPGTNLCFAIYNDNHLKHPPFTQVPCTKEVMNLIIDQESNYYHRNNK